MLEFFYNQILFFVSIGIVLFFPGWFLLLAVFGNNNNHIGRLERFVLSFGLGLLATDFIAFAYSGANIPITAFTAISGSFLFSLTCFSFFWFKRRKDDLAASKKENDIRQAAQVLVSKKNVFSFSKNQFFLVVFLIFAAFFIKTAYLSGTVAPTSTDMGHHMYWTKLMTQTHALPTYDGMPDFIIGEHVALGEMAMISGLSLFSAFPVVFLLLINILSILLVFLLALRIFENKNVAILTLLFLGVLFAVSSPQAKFISGGVMGNILGNMLTPMIFYFFYRALEFLKEDPVRETTGQKSKAFLALGVFAAYGLFYTHHLTAFIFLFTFAFLVFLYLAANYKEIGLIASKVTKIIFSVPVAATFLTGLVFFFFVFSPTYVKTSAVETAVGAPSKATREGLSLTNVKSSVGEARLALGMIGFALLILAYRRKNFGYAIVAGWTAMIFIMSTMPQIIFINLPSSRIGNYLTYPMAILAAFGLVFIFDKKRRARLPEKFLVSAFIVLLAFVLGTGLEDSADAFKKSPDFTPTLQTFNASAYLDAKTAEDEVLLKDHNYLSGDTWMKLYFMRGYTYPLSRSYFKRYEDETKPREMCTLNMISVPAGKDAKKCFDETNTRFVMVNPRYDSSQFLKLKNFDMVYNSGGVAIYYRK